MAKIFSEDPIPQSHVRWKLAVWIVKCACKRSTGEDRHQEKQLRACVHRRRADDCLKSAARANLDSRRLDELRFLFFATDYELVFTFSQM